MRKYIVGVATLLSLGVGVAPTFAQARVNPPPVSPYLNLFRRGSDPAINYYGLVRPQLEFRNSVQQLQQDVASGEATATDAAGLPVTGHTAQFNTQGKYFMTRGAQGTANRTVGAGASFRPGSVTAGTASRGLGR